MPDPIDVHVGSRVRLRRTLLGLTQSGLANKLGLTFQQIQKYERGTNRMGASRLVQIGAALGVDAPWFFEELPNEIQGFGRKGMAEDAADFEVERGFSKRETLELVRCFDGIENEVLRRRLLDLVQSIAAEGSDD